MKCKFCDGSGEDYWCLNGVPYPCPVCNGTGKIKDESLTNDEWRRTCSAKEFAEFLNNTTYDAWFAGRENEMPEIKGLRRWDSWLKEKHHER